MVYHRLPANTRPDAHPNALQISCIITARLAAIFLTLPLIQLLCPTTLNPRSQSAR